MLPIFFFWVVMGLERPKKEETFGRSPLDLFFLIRYYSAYSGSVGSKR